jgi:hypothetical protein
MSCKRTPWRAWLLGWLGAAVLGVANGIARGALPWSELFEQYNIARGKIWVLIPAWMAIGPAVLRNRQH